MAKKFFSTKAFANFSRVTRAKLLHYDRIGLLSPMSRENNSYRAYSVSQLSAVNLIRTFQGLGLTLDEIKKFKKGRTPAQTSELLTDMTRVIDKKITELRRSQLLLNTIQDSIRSVLNVDENSIEIKSMPAMPIILGDLNDYSKGRDDFDTLLSFYGSFKGRYLGLDLNYPVWGLFSEERIKNGDWKWPDRYYFFNPDGDDQRPAAQYAIGYARGWYGSSDELYKRLIDHIDNEGFEICGNAYEEYPLNEICISDDTSYLKRVMITVCKKE